MITGAVLAGGGFVAAAIVLVASGTRGAALSSFVLGLGFGGVAYLAGGIASLALLGLTGVSASLLIVLGGLVPGHGSLRWLLGDGPTVGRPRVFGQRSLALLLGLGGLLAARLLAGHLGAGTVSTQGPAFACLFAWEVGLIRAATARGPADMALGALAAGMGTAAFILLESAGSAWPSAALAAAAPALVLVGMARALPWEVDR